MNFENNKKYRALSLPMVLICISLTFWAFIIFSKAVNPEWLFVGDTINNLAQYSYHYSGIARGELPLWNPLVRAGEPEDIFYAMQLATHILNLVAVSSVLLGITNIVLSFSMYIYVCIFLYVAGVYFLVSSWTNNRYAGAFASILAIGSSTVYWYAYHISFIQILHTIPWMLYAFLMYFKEFKLKYLIMFVLSFCIALYTYEFVLGLSYLFVLLISVSLFYYKELPFMLRKLSKIPIAHVITLGVILIIVMIPQALMFGVETASEDLMKLINKNETVQENIDAIRLAKEIGFTVEATFIYGFPTETIEDRLAALSLAVNTEIDRARFNNATPYPGTEMYKMVRDKISIAPRWVNFSSAGAVTAGIKKKYSLPYVPDGCTDKELAGCVLLANLLFYLNFTNLKKLINPGQSGSGKWFEVSKKELLSPRVLLALLMLGGTVLLRTLYYLLSSKNCRRFFYKGLKTS